MSDRDWATIIYGRSYHLDFRTIAHPEDFTPQDTAWALEHIIPTTQRARNLSRSPRWSMFKGDRFCIIGVTCMVRDLIQPLDESSESIAKDDLGRPLYVFVGYVTSLAQRIDSFPSYREDNLADFRQLYRQVEDVWLVKNYDLASRQPILSPYRRIDFGDPERQLDLDSSQQHQIPELNHSLKYPHKTYLWSNFTSQNHLLWLAAIQCLPSTSICLNIKGKALSNSPFLNQTSSLIEQFQIRDRTLPQSLEKENPDPTAASLSQKISQRAKSDLDLTLQQAAKVASAGKELIDSWQDFNDPPTESTKQSESATEDDSFGFKKKNSR